MYINLSEIMGNLLQQHYEYLNKKDELVAYDLKYSSNKGLIQCQGTPSNNAVLVRSNSIFFDDTKTSFEATQDSCVVIIPRMTQILTSERDKTGVLLKKDTINLLISQEGDRYVSEYKKDISGETIEFCISKQVLREYLEELKNYDLLESLQNHGKFKILADAPLEHYHTLILEKMKLNPYGGELGKIYLENCVNELLFHILNSLNPAQKRDIKLSQDDQKMVIKADKILRTNFQNPPTIPQLCKMVATNKDKLTKGFKTLFDRTIFNALTEYKMQNAYENLTRTDMSVDEVAYECGYKSTSSFIHVFKKRYGITPGRMKERKNYIQ